MPDTNLQLLAHDQDEQVVKQRQRAEMRLQKGTNGTFGSAY